MIDSQDQKDSTNKTPVADAVPVSCFQDLAPTTWHSCANLSYVQHIFELPDKPPTYARSYALDMEMHFCIEAAMWDGEFFNVAPFKEPAAFGDATDGATMDIDALLKKSFA